MIRARLRETGRECEACILDVSSRGLCATAAEPPRHGAFIELLVGSDSLVGQVKWSGERRFGVQLRERISVIALVSGEGSTKLPTRCQTVAVIPRARDTLSARRLSRWVQSGALLVAAVAGAAALAVSASQALAPLDSVNDALNGSVHNAG